MWRGVRWLAWSGGHEGARSECARSESVEGRRGSLNTTSQEELADSVRDTGGRDDDDEAMSTMMVATLVVSAVAQMGETKGK